MTGGLKFRRGNKDYDQFAISPNSADDDYATSFYQRNGGQFRIRTTPDKNGNNSYKTHFIAAQPRANEPETRISWLVNPTSNHHAANKEYVDKHVFTPPGVEFMYQTDTGSTNNMPKGKFAIASAKNRMRISTISRYVDLTSYIPTGDFNYDGCVWPFTIWYRIPKDDIPDGSEHGWRMKVTGFLDRIDFHEQDLYCYISRGQWSTSAFGVDVYYMIHIGGLF